MLGAVLLLVLGLMAHGCAPSSQPRPSSAALAGSLLSLDGSSRTLHELTSGRPAVIALWATWCKACKAEQPKLARLARSVFVLGVDVGESPDAVLEYLSKHPLGYPVLLDPEFVWSQALGERAIPRLLVIDGHGRILHRSDTLDQATLLKIQKADRIKFREADASSRADQVLP